MTIFYQFDPYTKIYTGTTTDVLAKNSTTVEPQLALPTNQMTIIWDPVPAKWQYVEMMPASKDQEQYMNTILDYAAIRASEYPPAVDYMDGLVKGDVAQQAAYIAACEAVKARWPKTTPPMTRRDYFVQRYNMITYEAWLKAVVVDTTTPREPTILPVPEVSIRGIENIDPSLL